MKLVTLPVGDLLTNCYLLAAQSGRAAGFTGSSQLQS